MRACFRLASVVPHRSAAPLEAADQAADQKVEPLRLVALKDRRPLAETEGAAAVVASLVTDADHDRLLAAVEAVYEEIYGLDVAPS